MRSLIAVSVLLSIVIFYGCNSSGSSGDKSPLTGTEWIMFEMDGVKYEPASGKNVTMIFDSKEKNVGGKAQCNAYGGPYTKASNKLSFGGLFSTEMACDELTSEQKYFKLLETVIAYQISGDKLYLFDSGGMVILRFKTK